MSGDGPPEHGMPSGYKIIADSGFALRPWMMIPFTRTDMQRSDNVRRDRRYNLRLSQVRVCSAHAFGRIKCRFALLKCLPFEPAEATVVIHAALCLHNFLLDRRGSDLPVVELVKVLTSGEIE
jgi:hypothetical protein